MEIDRPIATAVIFFATLLLIFFLVAPKYRQFSDLRQKISEKQATYDAKFAYYSEIANIYEKIMAKKDIVDKIDTAIPSSPAFAPLVYLFQKKSVENGLIARGLFLTRVSNADPESNIKEIVFSLDLLGGYQAFKSFLSSLEKSARLFEINSISFSSSARTLEPLTPLKNKNPTQPQILQTYPFKLEITTYSY